MSEESGAAGVPGLEESNIYRFGFAFTLAFGRAEGLALYARDAGLKPGST